MSKRKPHEDTLDALLHARLSDDLTSANLAAVGQAIGIGHRVAEYKRGKWKRPPLETLDAICQQVGYTLAEALSEHDRREDWRKEMHAALAGLTAQDAQIIIATAKGILASRPKPPDRHLSRKKR